MFFVIRLDMPELRFNMIAREWVVISTERAKRPEDFRQWREKKYIPDIDPSCPFCAGNEVKTPGELMRIEKDGLWRVRAIPNKFAVLLPDIPRSRRNSGMKQSVSGYGRHEVIVESPLHNGHIPFLGVDEVADILRTYKSRFIEAYKDPEIEHVIIFKNHGEASGTTIQHPHSQLVATPVTPIQVRERLEEATKYYDGTGKCLMCATLKDELEDKSRIILGTEHFVSFIPYAAFSPFHMWIFPRRHMASFSDIEDREISDLALNLKTVLLKLYHGLDNPDFNYVLRSEGPEKHWSKYFHWYLSIVPRLSQASGFALGSGMYINPSIPEDVAEFMRNLKIP